MNRVRAVAIIAASCVAACLYSAAAARASDMPGGHAPVMWRTCTPYATRLIGALEYHNDAYGTSQRSCITVQGGRETIGTSYRPSGSGVVAYDAVEFGAYPYSRDLTAGLPAQVGLPMPTLHVYASGGPGTYLYDTDLWLSRTDAPGPMRHIREIIIANRWQGYKPYCAPYHARIGHRHYQFGACMTGGGTTSGRHLLIRFIARTQSARAAFPLAAFLQIARHHGWISTLMTVDSASYGPEVWERGKGLTYSMRPTVPAHYQSP